MVSVGRQEVNIVYTLFFLGPRAGNKNGKSSITLLTWPSQSLPTDLFTFMK